MHIWPVSDQSLRPRKTIMSDMNYMKLLNENKQCESQDEIMI